ncbi:DNA processing protein [Secundilactobacillus pentosiphilus]|uniref:DNA processing protein n=1 Tax=Secundilactobacillus pentosiphilus TaxID=1714682 RepID=A0A1Z5IVZ2_9LACO|nr:DNA-processing protein DprA [Secundilactobacillus pentosiphilus]GAX05856.1 DNA processing protein [Secundilactobacillus pentosiphilus]
MNLNQFLLRLHLTPGIGLKGEYLVAQWLADHPGQLRNLLPVEISAIAGILPQHRTKFERGFMSDKISQALARHEAESHYLTFFDAQYPLMLKESWLPPVVLFYQGNLDLLTASRLLSIVGSRKASPYAEIALKKILPEITAQDFVVVSGLAAGVDSLSHRLALRNHGHTIGVIATGLNLSYPASSQKLQQYMAEHELVISEYPLDAVGKRYRFVERNRLIAGLSQATLVVQAQEKSGSLITANLALQNNRDVMAVPGRIDDLLSCGCNQLIQAGAKAVLTARDILDEYPLLATK